MRKLNGYAAEVIKEIICEGDSIFEVDGKRYFLSLIEEPETTVEVLEMIEQGKL